jgi:hypothetical protein
MDKETNKPRLVFFQWNHLGLPAFLQLHMQQHIKCLSEFFDVVVINKDCDYEKICNIYQPDLALFESGYRTTNSKKITIKNTSAHPEVPKIGLHNGDAWCDCRVGFISDMDHWGIKVYFTIGTTMAEHTPQLADNLFVWPNFIDSDIYKDYGQYKIIPVLFNGNLNPLYPWRQKIFNIVSKCYPSLIFPHLGYESHSQVMFHGEQYARTINASWFVPACGTVAKEVVRKHFEIPGSRSCLITEKTPSLEAAGFIGMKNCVFADEEDVLDKLHYLFKNQDEIEKITNAGYNLVHAKHTLKQRDQILQWFNLNKNLKPNQRIVQLNPFGNLSVVEKKTLTGNTHITSDGPHLMLMSQGDEKLWEGRYDEAECLYLKCLDFIPWMSEPKLKLAVCNLYQNRAKDALDWIIKPIQYNLGSYKALDPDPIEWAYLIIGLLCDGNLIDAVIRAKQFPMLRHPELNRARLITEYFQNKDGGLPASKYQSSNFRHSIHQLPCLSFINWLNKICIMLNACGQVSYAESLKELVSLSEGSSLKPSPKTGNVILALSRHLLLVRIKGIERLNHYFEIIHIPNRNKGLPSISVTDFMIRLGKWLGGNIFKKIAVKYLPGLGK